MLGNVEFGGDFANRAESCRGLIAAAARRDLFSSVGHGRTLSLAVGAVGRQAFVDTALEDV